MLVCFGYLLCYCVGLLGFDVDGVFLCFDDVDDLVVCDCIVGLYVLFDEGGVVYVGVE